MFNEIEKGYGKCCKTTRNKHMHYMHGNRYAKSNIKNLKLMTFNKGSSWYPKNRDLILKAMRDEKRAICCVTESCFRPDEKFLYDNLDDYNLENKFLPGLKYARVTIIIKKGIE